MREALARQQAAAEDLRAVLARVEGQQAEALREAQALAERRGEEVAELREKLARQEATVEGLQPLVARLEADRASVVAELSAAYAEGQEARQLADRRAVELAEVRERAGRAEAEREAADRRAREMATERDQAAHQVEAVRAELAGWREGGPIARAWRAFLYRKVL
jgi:chromosome segregation ATPase